MPSKPAASPSRRAASNPSILIVARAHSDAEVDELKQYGADTVIMGEREIALGMVDRLAQVHHDRPHYEDAERPDSISEPPVSDPAKE